MDFRDVSWTEEDQKEEFLQVKAVNSRRRPKGWLRDLDMSEIDGTMVCSEVYSMVT
jgi:hypothetical protein